jgi:hypothetical protein
LVGRGDPLPWPTAFGTDRSLVRSRPHARVGGDMLFEEPSRQLLAEAAGARFALVEGDELVLARVVEHPIKGDRSPFQPALAQLGTGPGGWRRMLAHESDSPT